MTNQINYKDMKRKALKAFAKGLIWLENEKNEKIAVNTLSGITAMLIVDIALLVIGYMIK